MSLTGRDYEKLAQELSVEVPAIKAVVAVEAGGDAFIYQEAMCVPKILFEGHVFWRQLKKHGLDPTDHLTNNASILYPSWTRSHYKGGIGEYKRLDKAARVHYQAAMESASWGMFQIMGYHWKALGYNELQEFLADMWLNELGQLRAFGRFCNVNGLTEHLRDKDWAKFARGYNGSGYAKNRYDVKLENAYNKYKD